MAVTARLNITIPKGVRRVVPLTWSADNVPVNLTGKTGKLQVRAKAEDTGTALLELTTENGGLVFGGETGNIDIVFEPGSTSAVTWKKGVYDLVVYDGGVPTAKPIKGEVELDVTVTK